MCSVTPFNQWQAMINSFTNVEKVESDSVPLQSSFEKTEVATLYSIECLESLQCFITAYNDHWYPLLSRCFMIVLVCQSFKLQADVAF